MVHAFREAETAGLAMIQVDGMLVDYLLDRVSGAVGAGDADGDRRAGRLIAGMVRRRSMWRSSEMTLMSNTHIASTRQSNS